MNLDEPLWKAANFECRNIPVATKSENNNFIEKFFVNKQIAIGFNSEKISYHNKLSLEKEGNIKKNC